MPLRDHFHPPLSERRTWSGLHAAWPTFMLVALNAKLPDRFVAEPRVSLGTTFEVDIAAFDQYPEEPPIAGAINGGGGGVATAILAPPEPTLVVATEMPAPDEYEVLIRDMAAGRLVAVVEVISPSNKDRPESRRAFVAKVASLLMDDVCVAIVDLVTERRSNLYSQLLDFFGVTDPALPEEPPAIYATACRWRKRRPTGFLEAWAHPLEIGRPLPTLPLWLDESIWVPLDLESTYEETCRNLRLP